MAQSQIPKLQKRLAACQSSQKAPKVLLVLQVLAQVLYSLLFAQVRIESLLPLDSASFVCLHLPWITPQG